MGFFILFGCGVIVLLVAIVVSDYRDAQRGR